MSHFFKISLFLFILLFNVTIRAQESAFPDKTLFQGEQVPSDQLRQGIDMIIMGKYDDLLKYTDVLQQNEDEIPRKFLLASMYYARMGELESLKKIDEFYLLVDQIVDETKSRIEIDPNDIKSRFYLGSVLSFRAVIRQKEGGIYRAWRDGANGKKELEKCLEIAPDFLEPHLAIGSYRYWASAKNPFKILPFVKDDRKIGILEIDDNIKPSSFSYPLSLNQLIWIHLDNKNYERAESIAQQGMKLYPSSRFFLFPAAIVAQELEQWSDAAELLQQVKESLESDGLENTYFWVKVAVKQVESLVESGEIAKAISLSSAVLQSSIVPADLEKSRDYIARAKKIGRLSANHVKN